jgi:hypothetical protein
MFSCGFLHFCACKQSVGHFAFRVRKPFESKIDFKKILAKRYTGHVMTEIPNARIHKFRVRTDLRFTRRVLRVANPGFQFYWETSK